MAKSAWSDVGGVCDAVVVVSVLVPVYCSISISFVYIMGYNEILPYDTLIYVSFPCFLPFFSLSSSLSAHHFFYPLFRFFFGLLLTRIALPGRPETHRAGQGQQHRPHRHQPEGVLHVRGVGHPGSPSQEEPGVFPGRSRALPRYCVLLATSSSTGALCVSSPFPSTVVVSCRYRFLLARALILLFRYVLFVVRC